MQITMSDLLLARIGGKLDLLFGIRLRSLKAAAREQGLDAIVRQLEVIIPDISDQYTSVRLDSEYITRKIRQAHAFQTRLALKACDLKPDARLIVDIGDSSGTHLRYIKALLDHDVHTLSVNMDPHAVERIRAKGLEAVCCRAEELHHEHGAADIFLLFETLEHFMNPARFLYDLGKSTPDCLLVVTVPYVARSRIGLHHLRGPVHRKASAENTHIFELSPQDLRLLCNFTGWEIVHQETYLQYPRRHPLRLTKSLWRAEDLEGFFGLILRPAPQLAELYTDW